MLCESVVTTRALQPGDVITSDDVKLMSRRINNYRDVGIDDFKAVIGQEVARSISAHTIVLPAMIRKIKLVKRNQMINIHSAVGQVHITVQGKALSDGGYGETIPVRFGAHKTVVRGQITGSGAVTIPNKMAAKDIQIVAVSRPGRQNKIFSLEK
jgi:flagella basal body P-ring formation protein FlgA